MKIPELHFIEELTRRWSLTLGRPYQDGTCSWVAPATMPGGTAAVLKVALAHMEGDHEIDGLRFWNGEPTVRVFESDDTLGAVLLERCDPGTPLRDLPEPEQDEVLASLLKRLWRRPSMPHPFRPLSIMLEFWSNETLAPAQAWPDEALVGEGLQLFAELSRCAATDVLLATDLHAGNVLQAGREPWLVIDPKPFVGDRAYDAKQHLMNCTSRLLARPHETVYRFADLLCLDRERVRLWTFARMAAEPRPNWSDETQLTIARALARSN